MKPLATFLLLASTGCVMDIGDDPPNIVSSVGQDVTANNGTSLNGTSLNGTSLNGSTLGSVAVSGKNAAGATINAATTGSPPWTGSTLVGSTWTGTASNGVALNLRIDSATQGTAPNTDLWYYGVSYQTTAGWSPLCGLDGASQPIKAGTVIGTWDATNANYQTSSTKFSVVCQGKSIEKCIEMGYKTFKNYTNQMQSCIRMLRADYCGTGTSYTVDGTLINVYDNVGIQADTQTWTMEAAWATNGATCIKSGIVGRWALTATTPPCLSTKSTTGCGTSWTGVYVMDEYN